MLNYLHLKSCETIVNFLDGIIYCVIPYILEHLVK